MTQQDAQPSAAALFAILWDDLSDVLGSSATATLLRRALKHGAGQRPKLKQLVIHRPAFEYEYVVPNDWHDDEVGRDELVVLVRMLIPLLRELTGVIVVQRLRSIPELVRAGLVNEEVSS